ncbi:MAG TPA: hypothetical protein VKO16_03150, partial [Polyangia bacterium]|nr:hypothetical protein [Polyangia bacterium]
RPVLELHRVSFSNAKIFGNVLHRHPLAFGLGAPMVEMNGSRVGAATSNTTNPPEIRGPSCLR